MTSGNVSLFRFDQDCHRRECWKRVIVEDGGLRLSANATTCRIYGLLAPKTWLGGLAFAAPRDRAGTAAETGLPRFRSAGPDGARVSPISPRFSGQGWAAGTVLRADSLASDPRLRFARRVSNARDIDI